jgi:hypothetical protein
MAIPLAINLEGLDYSNTMYAIGLKGLYYNNAFNR